MGMPENAIAELEEEKKLNPKLAEPYEYEGDILMLTRKFSQASGQYQKAIDLKPPQTANLYVKLARAYRLQGLYDQCESMLRQGQSLESGNSEIYKEYGWLFVAKSQPEYAVEAFEKYLRLEPNSPDKQQILDKINEIK
jgi:tetratricopeptide (TPR) repeat protein